MTTRAGFAARVVAVQTDAIEVRAIDAIATGCSAGAACCQRQALARRVRRDRPLRLPLAADGTIPGATVPQLGDVVWCEVALSPEQALRRVWGLPLLGVLGGALSVHAIVTLGAVPAATAEGLTLLGGLLGLGLGLYQTQRQLSGLEQRLLPLKHSGTELACQGLSRQESMRAPGIPAEDSIAIQSPAGGTVRVSAQRRTPRS